MKDQDRGRYHGAVVGFWAMDLTPGQDLDLERNWTSTEISGQSREIREIARCTGRTAPDVAARFESGASCAALYVDGSWATSGWVSTSHSWVSELATWFIPLPDEVYIWDCLTRSQYRGHGLYPRFLRLICQGLALSRWRRVWIATEWRNWRSASGIARAGFSPVGAVVVIQSGAETWRRLVPDPEASNDVVTALCRSLGPPRCDDSFRP